MDSYTQLATLISPIISAFAIFVALFIARRSSKDAQEQIKAIHHLLDVFVAANNLNIVEAQRKYQQQLCELNPLIENAQIEVDIVNPFRGGARIEQVMEAEKKAKQKAYFNQLLKKRREIEINLSLINDYINKATK
ncbi:MAG: hypothetical protein Q4G12_09180 [Bacteroidales bacterium]|nr:hypothetical protein [Bacteroidales bacterium]